MIAVGLVTRARTGRLVDRFRDRLVLPITADDTVLGFVARRHPDAGDEHGPKYLNTPTTPLFHKGDVLYGVDHQLLEGGAVPVLVEGPLDALAITSAGAGMYVGVAPLGTSLTQTQARLLATLHPSPIVATDADAPGRAAAERAYWLLTQHAVSPRSVRLPEGSDPASVLRDSGPTVLTATIAASHPLAEDLIAEQRAHLPEIERIRSVAAVIAADNPRLWQMRIESLREHNGPTLGALWAGVAASAARWNHDPVGAASQQLAHAVRAGMRPEPTPNTAGPTGRSAVGKLGRPQPPMEPPGLPANRALLEVSSTGQLRSEEPTRPNEDEQKLLHRRDRRLGRSRWPR